MAKRKPRSKKSDTQADPVKSARGRPSKFSGDTAAQAEKLCRLGATDADLADFFDVTIRTIERWRVQHEDFCRASKIGKDETDDRVERSLYQRAVGYSFEALKIMQFQGSVVKEPYREHVPPDTTAAIFWLKNRRPEAWRDISRQELTGKDGEPIKVANATDEILSRISRLAARGGVESGSRRDH